MNSVFNSFLDFSFQPFLITELIPVNKRPGVVKKVEKITSVVTSIVQQSTPQQQPQQLPQAQAQSTPTIQVVHTTNELKKAKPNHPRIKYSRHKNPTFISQLSDQHIQPIISSRPSVQTVPVINNDTPKKIEYISLTTKIPPLATTSATLTPPKAATIFIPNTNTQFIIQPASTSQTSSSQQFEITQAPSSQNNEFSTEIMDELDYSGIDDIELPDDVHVQFSDSSFKDDTGNGTGDSGGENGSQVKKYHFSISDNSMASDNEESGRQFECKTCGKRYRWKSTLRRHENVECGGKEALHQCLYCNYRSKQRGNLGVSEVFFIYLDSMGNFFRLSFNFFYFIRITFHLSGGIRVQCFNIK